MSGGYAVAFVSFVLAISCVAVAALFFYRAKVMDSILNSTEPLAHWVYSSAEVEKAARREYDEYRERNRALFFIVGGMLVLFAIAIIIFAGYEGFITGLFLLAITVLLFIVSRVAPAIALRNALKAPREAYIAENGIIYEGIVYPFSSFFMKMDGVKFEKASGNKPSAIIFSFTQLIGLYNSTSFDIKIPVPEGDEKTAYNVADTLGGTANQNQPQSR